MCLYSFVACLSHLTIDHASLSRRSTVPTPIVETPPAFGCSLRFSPPMLHKKLFAHLLPRSCFAVYGHHLSPRISTVFSLISSVPNFSMSHSSVFLISVQRVGGVLIATHGRSGKNVHPRTPTIPGAELVGFSPTMQALLAPSTGGVMRLILGWVIARSFTPVAQEVTPSRCCAGSFDEV